MPIKNYFRSLIAAILGGAVLTLAFAPFGYAPLAVISLIILGMVEENVNSPKQAFVVGWFFGLAFFSTGIYWIYISIYTYGGGSLISAWILVVLLAAYLALYPAFHGYLLKRYFNNVNPIYRLLIIFPSLWVILEWLRGWVLTGFPWLYVGYSQIDSWIGGFAPVLGVYGVSMIVAQTAGALLAAFRLKKSNNTFFLLVGYVFSLWVIGTGISKINWGGKVERELRTILVQGNIGQEQKWQEGEHWKSLKLYSSISMDYPNYDLIVWPEAAIPIFRENISDQLNELAVLFEQRKNTILTGIPIYDYNNNRSYNGIIAIGLNRGKYHKIHLLPFGEYLPCRAILNWINRFIFIPMSDFSAGDPNQSPILINNVYIAPLICYEIAYADLVLNHMPKVGLIVTVSDDSWFGKSIAAAQHLEIARMRSLEVGRSQIFSTNTGISAIIDHRGKIIARTRPFKQEVLEGKIDIVNGITPWVYWGRYVVFLLVWIGILLARVFHLRIA